MTIMMFSTNVTLVWRLVLIYGVPIDRAQLEAWMCWERRNQRWRRG